MEISRTSPCVCGSGRRFKNCCGKLDAPQWTRKSIEPVSGTLLDSPHRHLFEGEPVCAFEGTSLPPGLLVRRLSDDYDWKTVAANVTAVRVTKSAVVLHEAGQDVDEKHRVTSNVHPGAWEGPVRELVRRAYIDEVEPFFDRRLRWFSEPEILRYASGGYYRPHADSDNFDAQTGTWKRVVDRHLSLLIYLDSSYAGGQLAFPNFDYRLSPEAGMLVAFPSDHRYLHGAMPVFAGTRHVIVSWAAIEGEELLQQEMPAHCVPRQPG